METSEFIITSDLARAARALTQVAVANVAKRSDLDPERLRAFEHHRGRLTTEEKSRLRQALEGYGVLFLPEDDQGGYGVRRKFTRTKVRRLESWENEGGPAYEDDI